MIASIIFDWKRTLYDPDTQSLVNGAIGILEFVKSKNIPMYLVGKGGVDMYAETKRLGIEAYFIDIVFKEGVKEEGLFSQFLSHEPKSTLFIGDRIQSELAVGKALGATTLWLRQGKFAEEAPLNKKQEPDYTVTSLIEAKELLQRLLKQ